MPVRGLSPEENSLSGGGCVGGGGGGEEKVNGEGERRGCVERVDAVDGALMVNRWLGSWVGG